MTREVTQLGKGLEQLRTDWNAATLAGGRQATTHRAPPARQRNHDEHTGPWAHPAPARKPRRKPRRKYRGMALLTYTLLAIGAASLTVSFSGHDDTLRALITEARN